MAIKFAEIKCPLCGQGNAELFFEDQNREYRQCSCCELVFVPHCYWLCEEEERAVYDLHQNDPEDTGYRHFLRRLTTPLLEKLEPGQIGLDFGCGPGPALAAMLEEQGLRVDLYDPFYYNDISVFDKRYDFICATEVVEHLREPDNIFTALFKMLKPGAWLGIMTKRVIDKKAFRRWHYIRDMTHICFYRQGTFEYLAHRFDATLEVVSKDVLFFRTPS